MAEPTWAIVANVVERKIPKAGVAAELARLGELAGQGDLEAARTLLERLERSALPGTRHFSPSTKVWTWPSCWQDAERVRVLGRHRGSRRLVDLVMAVMDLQNWRVKLAYEPAVLRSVLVRYRRPEDAYGKDDLESFLAARGLVSGRA